MSSAAVRQCSDYQLVPFGTRHFELLKSWVRTERQAIEWGGRNVHFPLTDALLDVMLTESEGASPSRYCWMLEAGGSPVAHAQAAIDWSRTSARLARIIVTPDRRGEGIGLVLLGEIASRLFAQGFGWLDLNVFLHNHSARALYTKFGFKPCGIVRDAFSLAAENWHLVQMRLTAAEYGEICRVRDMARLLGR